MKKFSKLSKRMLFGVVPAALACSLSVGLLHDVKPVAVEEVRADGSGSSIDVDNQIYTLRKTDPHSFELLFSAEPRDYKALSFTFVKDLATNLKAVLRDIIHTKMEDISAGNKTHEQIEAEWADIEGTDAPATQEVSDPVLPPEAIDLHIINTATSYVSLDTFAEILYNYSRLEMQVDGTFIAGPADPSRISANHFTAYMTYYCQDYFNSHLGYDKTDAHFADVLHDARVLLASHICDLFAAEGLDNIYDAYNFVAARTAGINKDYSVKLNNVSAMLMLVRSNTETGVDDLGVKNLLATLGGDFVISQIKELVVNASPEEIGNFFKEVPVKVVELVINLSDFDNNNLHNMVETVPMSKWIEIVGEVGVSNVRDIFNSVPNFSKNDLIEQITNLASPKDFWNAIKNITIDGIKIMENKQFKVARLTELIKKFPGFETLSHYSDSQFRHKFEMVLDTAMDPIIVNATVGFKGDCSKVRRICQIISDHISIKTVGDQKVININFPGLVTSLYKKVLSTEILTDSLKRELYDIVFSSFDEIYQYIHSKTIDDLKNYAQDIDYHTLVNDITDADEIERIIGTRRLSQEQLDKLINKMFSLIEKGSTFDVNKVYEIIEEFVPISDKTKEQIDKIVEKLQKVLKKIADRHYDAAFIHDYLERYTSEEFNEKVYNKIDDFLDRTKVRTYYEKFQSYLARAYAKVPESLRSKTVMDWYVGDGTWHGEREFNINWIKLVRKIPRIGQKLADALASFFDHLPEHFNINLTCDTKDIYRIDYVLPNVTKSRALPKGLSGDLVAFYSNVEYVTVGATNYPVIKWVEASTGTYPYSVVNEMPDHDTQVMPLYFETSNDVSEIYSGSEFEISVSANYETGCSFSYQWFKDGAEISGANEPTYKVKNVGDSGVYTCTVDGVEVGTINVAIAKQKVDLPTQTQTIEYDTNSHHYYEAFGATSEDNLLFTGVSGDLIATNPNDYVAQLELKDQDNYEWSSGTGAFSWNIGKKIIHIDTVLEWDYTSALTYDGTEQSVTLKDSVIAALPEGVQVTYTNNAKTNAGSYTAKAVITAVDPLVEVTGNTQSTLSWVINKKHVQVPADIALVEDSFMYDGNEHSVTLDTSSLDPVINVAYSGDITKTNANVPGEHYTLHAAFSVNNPNYVLDSGYPENFNWTIGQKIIDATGITWNYTDPFYFDGTVKSVALAHLPSNLHVEYSNATATAPGTYSATATISCADNFKIKVDESGEYHSSYTYHLTWTILPLYNEFKSIEKDSNGNSFVCITLSDGVKEEKYLHAKSVETGTINVSSLDTKDYVASVLAAYDINFTDVYEEISDIGASNKCTYTIRILAPEGLKEGQEFFVCYVAEDGTLTKYETQREGNYLVITTNHLSVYSIVTMAPRGTEPKTAIIPIAAAALALQASGIFLIVILAKRKRRTMNGK